MDAHLDAGCLSDDAVLDFVAGRLTGTARGDVERHLGQCLLCNRLVGVGAGYQEPPPAHVFGPDDVVPRAANDHLAGHPTMEGRADGGSMPAERLLRETYRLVRLIGRGGMGEVFEATHARLTGRYAVKVLHHGCAGDPKAIIRFRREAEITSGLRHPNIVAIVDFDYTPDGSPYLVMEYLDGVELARVIAEQAPLALDRILRIVDQIASALSAVHRRNIVHRDLKPQNIFLVPGERPREEHVKLVDFGISKVRAASVALTGERVLLGTPQYMAPEQARGTGEVDARADQFALAAIVYEMLTGRLAFPGDRVEVVVYRISHEPPRPLGPPWGAALAAVIERALAKEPDQRFPSVQEFATALHAAADADHAPSAPGALSRTTMRHVTGEEPAAIEAPSRHLPVSAARRRAVAGAVAGVGLAALLAVPIVVRSQHRAHGDPAVPAEVRVPAVTPSGPAIPPQPPVVAAGALAGPAAAPRAQAHPVSPRKARGTRKPVSAPAASVAGEGEPTTAPAAPATLAAPAAPSPSGTPTRDSKRGSLIDKL